MELLVLAGLGILLALGVDGWLFRIAIQSDSIGTRVAAGAGILASTAGGAFAVLLFLLGLMLMNCPTDGSECL